MSNSKNNVWQQKGKIISNGLLTSNPTFRLVLGMCPTLAVTTSAFSGLGMGLAATVVLVCSNALVSLLRKVIPDKVRIPAFVLIIATFVSLLQMLLQKFIPTLYSMLGVYLPLIVVNCIILARAEAFASVNKVSDSILDGLGMGLGFTLALTLLGFIREFIGSGTIFMGSIGATEFGLTLGKLPEYSMSLFVLPAGGFLTLGLVMAAFNAIYSAAEKKKKEKMEAIAAQIEEAKKEAEDFAKLDAELAAANEAQVNTEENKAENEEVAK
ncbi:MAG: electron transport complex subunit E [Clostridia bacterium]|nr:electron transport complex subunit E [Clostridia bacterium]